ncbi:hypothetical protein V8E55_001247 [Tylopilus felleus]
MTGRRGSANALLDVTQQALEAMKVAEAKNFIAVTTDNLTVMQVFRRKFQAKFYWVLTFPCFLHGLNTIIGEICSFPWMKQNIAKSTRVVTFFNSSHYWGGQLKEEATRQKVTRTLKQNCESRWYALILQILSILDHRQPLTITCTWPDAMRRTDGFSGVAAPVIHIIIRDDEFWPAIVQLIKTCKPLVNMIGDSETRDASLASCMLELIRAARKMSQIALDDGDHAGFWMHAKQVFNRRFHVMNTDYHSLTLYLHPMCCKLATSIRNLALHLISLIHTFSRKQGWKKLAV